MDEPSFALGASAADVFPFAVTEQTLSNGFRVVVIPYDSPGIVAHYTVVRTGSREEVEPGHSGFAHFFEHMMFRGTPTYPPAAYNAVLKRMGADSNATTNDDRTLYHIVGPASELEAMMRVESDRFQNLKYNEESFKTEAKAVEGEYNKSVASPFLPMVEKLRDLAFQKHTYKHTTIGTQRDIQAMPGYYRYSLAFFDRYYRPENCILLVVGDAEPARVFALAQHYYGAWKPGYRGAEIPAEPPQTSPNRAHLHWPNPIQPYLMLGFHAPGFSSANPDSATLDILAELLFSETAPLFRELIVDKQWSQTLSGGLQDHRDPYLFMVVTRIKSEDLVAQVEQAIAAAFTKLQSEPVDPARLEKIRSHLRYAFASRLDSPAGVAEAAARALALTGSVASIPEIYAQYDRVTPADLVRVATAVFQPGNETVVTLAHSSAAPAKSGA